MTESLNVIALISGGKDSFYSVLHCIQNGHKVIALGNLHPPKCLSVPEDEHDLDSFMYQTVGHPVIPLYEEAFGIPLYREPIAGDAIDIRTIYKEGDEESHTFGMGEVRRQQDETESLVPLLKRIMKVHPTANALSTGAILSTYQRTRIENVAYRLGLTPLSYLWQYPFLSESTSLSLLEDMESVGLDARIVKVASAGLDENFLWRNVASRPTMQGMQKIVNRFSDEADGAVLGEGGEYETLVVDGPAHLFKGRIVVPGTDRRAVKEDGGSVWLQISDAKVVMKRSDGSVGRTVPIPYILEPEFLDLSKTLNDQEASAELFHKSEQEDDWQQLLYPISGEPYGMLTWTFTSQARCSISDEATGLIDEIISRLKKAELESTCIVSTVLLLRSMHDFAVVNEIYSTLFPKPNPPTRVTISCGNSMSPNTNLKIHVILIPRSSPPPVKIALHVQSRSYWAPANIGPYSQATSVSLPSTDGELTTVSIAGQIPLVPATMQLPVAPAMQTTAFYTALSLQHLWRIGRATHVGWWTSAIAYIPRETHSSHSHSHTLSERILMASQAWQQMHMNRMGAQADDMEDTSTRDLWAERYHAGMGAQCLVTRARRPLPDWSQVRMVCADYDESDTRGGRCAPPFFAVEVCALPKASPIEWHAQLGLVCGAVPILLRRHSTQDWVIHQCVFGRRMQVIIAIGYTQDTAQVRTRLMEAWAHLNWGCAVPREADQMNGSFLYRDDSLAGVEYVNFGCMIPCQSLWDAMGKRLAIVLICNTC